ncbi:uncharacterized protein LOC119113868 [Pollicipes pollicipes]|uniref:uncharacterized protein LOC119113868 n=1 Tax=Pollicipes pollicipes TaxID=41117 RepID=UPI00188507BF|nr:uncharacterized protein LOC119113868 [Pollicipes pollicipes]
MAGLLCRLLLLQLLLAPTLAFNITVETVLKADAQGQIASQEYWDKFRAFMELLSKADAANRTKLLSIPHIHEFLVPPQLLSAVAEHLSNSTWLSKLGAEYHERGGHAMAPLIDVLTNLGKTSVLHEVTIPRDVLEKLMWRALVRREQQGALRSWVGRAVSTFFNSSEALRMQRADSSLFADYIHSLFELDWIPLKELLMDTLQHHSLRAKVAAEMEKARRGGKEAEPHAVDEDDPERDPVLSEWDGVEDRDVRIDAWFGAGIAIGLKPLPVEDDVAEKGEEQKGAGEKEEKRKDGEDENEKKKGRDEGEKKQKDESKSPDAVHPKVEGQKQEATAAPETSAKTHDGSRGLEKGGSVQTKGP